MVYSASRRVGGVPAALFCCALAALLAPACSEDETGSFYQARAYQVTDRSQLVGGPKALGNLGDYVLENDRIRVLINGHATDMSGGGSNKWGGSIMDADIRRFEDAFDPAAMGRDQIIEMVPMFDIKTFGLENLVDEGGGTGPAFRAPQDAVEVLSDGSGGGAAVIRVSGVLHNLIWLLSVLEKPPLSWPMRAETVYTLEPGHNHVEVTTTFTKLNEDGSDPGVRNPEKLRAVEAGDNLFTMLKGEAFGDALFYGDSLDVIGPGVFGFSTGFYIEDLYKAGVSVFLESPQVEWSAGVSEDVGYGLVTADGPLCFPLLEDFLTIGFQKVASRLYRNQEPGATYSYTRYLIVDEGDVAGILNHVVDLKGWAYGLVKGRVVRADTGRGASGVKVLLCRHPRFSDGRLVPVVEDLDRMNAFLQSLRPELVDVRRLIPYTRFRTDALRADRVEDGSFEGKVPPGDYIVLASGPGNARSKLYPLRVEAGAEQEVFLVLDPTGSLRVEVRTSDPRGPCEPVKVTVIGVKGEARPDPFLGEGFLPAGLARVLLTQDGIAAAELPAGTYRVIAGRGPEYTAAEKTVSVEPMATREVQLAIDRVVDTAGWVAADQHMHTEVSPDSSLSNRNRLLSGMSEGLDLITGTDHDWIANYRPEQEEMGANDLIRVQSGDELSHFSYAHFNGYPLRHDRTQTSGGAPQWRDPSPTTRLPDGSVMPEYTPKDCFAALRARTDRGMVDQDAFVVVNHPEESFTGYLRAFGFEQYSGKFGSPDFLTIGDPVVNNGELLASDGSVNFSWDFDGIEALNGKRWQDFRTATEEEVAEAGSPLLPVLIRTVEEQDRIRKGELLLDSGETGAIDDYLTLLAMGRRYTAVGNSDSHDTVKTENGKCRTYVMSSQDDPRFLDENEILASLKQRRALATNGPFLEAWVDGRPIGSDVHDPDGTAQLRIRAQAAPWVSLDRIEIYGNGELIGEIKRDPSAVSYPSAAYPFIRCETGGKVIQGSERVVRFDGVIPCHLERDTSIVVIGIGFEGMTPHFTPVDGPTIEITDSLVLALRQILGPLADVLPLDSLESRLERHHPIYPFVLTNAIFVDTDGVDADGDGHAYDGPGFIPGWFDEEDVPEELRRVEAGFTIPEPGWFDEEDGPEEPRRPGRSQDMFEKVRASSGKSLETSRDLQLLVLAVKARVVSLTSAFGDAGLGR